MGFVDKMMGVPSARKQAAASVAAKANTPARSADKAKESDAVVLDQEESEVDTSGTDVAVTRGKKTTRKGVPGLGL